MSKISVETVRADFNEPGAVLHYARAAHFLGLWESERVLIQRFFTDLEAPILEAGCGAGRVAVGLWHLGYRRLTGFDMAGELVDQAQSLAREHGAAIRFFLGDATDPGLVGRGNPLEAAGFGGALFMFNGLMQIPGRDLRQRALRTLHEACRPGAPLMFTTHDRNGSPTEHEEWEKEAERWRKGLQDPRLLEFGDRYFAGETGNTFMHVPDRGEILEDLASCGWEPVFDASRREVAVESRAVREFSDECRFWVARQTTVGRRESGSNGSRHARYERP